MLQVVSTVYKNVYSFVGCSEFSIRFYKESGLEAYLNQSYIFRNQELVLCPIGTQGMLDLFDYDECPSKVCPTIPRVYYGLPVWLATSVSATITGHK